MKNFNGKVLFLDRSDINTDEIIPAKYLTEISKEALKPYLLEDLKLEGFSPEKAKEVGSNHEMVEKISSIMGSGDLILLKGSRMIGLDQVAEGLRENLKQGE